jgi:cobalamin biosynthesis Mg chelatase CobN
VVTGASSYLNTQTGTITATITPAPLAGSVVQLQVINPYSTVLFTKAVTIVSGGVVSANFTTGNPYWEWVPGTYTVSATWTAASTTVLVGLAQFSYSGPPTPVTSTTTTSASTTTATVTSTVQGPTTTVTTAGPATTVTSVSTTAGPVTTETSTSTVTQTNSTTPTWAYGSMIVLLAIGLAIGYVVAGPRLKKA